MRTVKKIMIFTSVISVIASLFGCAPKKPQVVDGPGMEYKDSDYRTVYANVFDFDGYDGHPHFAVAFLGYGEIESYRHAYVEGLFDSLSDFEIEQIGHIDYEGDEWYLVVPRYKDPVDITELETGEVHRIYSGEAFTVRCNLSDIHPNIEITTEDSGGAHRFSPQMGGDGKLVGNPDVWDITDYTLFDENMFLEGEG